jgi:hypothetical protein
VVTQEVPETKEEDVKQDDADKAKDKTIEPKPKRPRGRVKGTKFPQTKYVDRGHDVLAKIEQLSNQLQELKVTSNRVGSANSKQVERTPTPEPGAEKSYFQQRVDRLQARKQNYSNLFNSIHK